MGAEEAWQAWLSRPREQSFYSTEDVFKAGYQRALEDAAEGIDRGPEIPLPPSVYSALCREWAGDVKAEAAK